LLSLVYPTVKALENVTWTCEFGNIILVTFDVLENMGVTITGLYSTRLVNLYKKFGNIILGTFDVLETWALQKNKIILYQIGNLYEVKQQ
jgi:hypothetical protein